jgi:hypothetical protein
VPHTRTHSTRLHDNILRHPFFWSADRATAFLVGLGNVKLSQQLLARIEQVIHEEIVARFGYVPDIAMLRLLLIEKKTDLLSLSLSRVCVPLREGKVWWDVIDRGLWQAKKSQLAERTAGRGEYKPNPHQLLRFIRNCHAHANQATRPGEDSIFTHRPYFLDLLPGLVVKLWELRASTEVGQVLAQIYRPSLHAHQDMRPH